MLLVSRILNLQESGEIKKLKEKYWPKSGKCSLNEEGATTSARERTLEVSTGSLVCFKLLHCDLVKIGNFEIWLIENIVGDPWKKLVYT